MDKKDKIYQRSAYPYSVYCKIMRSMARSHTGQNLLPLNVFIKQSIIGR